MSIDNSNKINDKEYLELVCLKHNLVVIVDFEETKKANNLKDIEIKKLGKNYFNIVPQSDLYDNGFICSYCNSCVYIGIRYICINCRGCDILYTCSISNYSGYIDICEVCFDGLSNKYNPNKNFNAVSINAKNNESSEEAISVLDKKVIKTENHYFNTHCYIRLLKRTSNYFIY